MMFQAVTGLTWLHRITSEENEGYSGAHGDIKAENILVTTNFVVKASYLHFNQLQTICQLLSKTYNIF